MAFDVALQTRRFQKARGRCKQVKALTSSSSSSSPPTSRALGATPLVALLAAKLLLAQLAARAATTTTRHDGDDDDDDDGYLRRQHQHHHHHYHHSQHTTNATEKASSLLLSSSSSLSSSLTNTNTNNDNQQTTTWADYWTSKPFPSGYTQSSITLLACFISTIIFLIIVGNCLVCIAIFTEKSLKPTQNWFIASLAVSDMLLGLVVMPFSLARELMGFWIFGQLWCDIHEAMDVLLTTASINTLCLISLDRYWSITQAITYIKKRTPRRGAFMIAFVWILSAAVSLPPLFGWKKKPIESGISTSGASVELDAVQRSAENRSTLADAGMNLAELGLRRLVAASDGNGAEPEQLLGRSSPRDATGPSGSVPQILSPPLSEYPQCQLSDDVGYVLYSAIGSFYIPCAVMVFTYIKIFLAARSRARRTLKQTRPAMRGVTANAGSGSRNAPNATSGKTTTASEPHANKVPTLASEAPLPPTASATSKPVVVERRKSAAAPSHAQQLQRQARSNQQDVYTLTTSDARVPQAADIGGLKGASAENGGGSQTVAEEPRTLVVLGGSAGAGDDIGAELPPVTRFNFGAPASETKAASDGAASALLEAMRSEAIKARADELLGPTADNHNCSNSEADARPVLPNIVVDATSQHQNQKQRPNINTTTPGSTSETCFMTIDEDSDAGGLPQAGRTVTLPQRRYSGNQQCQDSVQHTPIHQTQTTATTTTTTTRSASSYCGSSIASHDYDDDDGDEDDDDDDDDDEVGAGANGDGGENALNGRDDDDDDIDHDDELSDECNDSCPIGDECPAAACRQCQLEAREIADKLKSTGGAGVTNTSRQHKQQQQQHHKQTPHELHQTQNQPSVTQSPSPAVPTPQPLPPAPPAPAGRNLRALRQNFFSKLNLLTAKTAKQQTSQDEAPKPKKKKKSGRKSPVNKSSTQSSGTSYEPSYDYATTSNVHSLDDNQHDNSDEIQKQDSAMNKGKNIDACKRKQSAPTTTTTISTSAAATITTGGSSGPDATSRRQTNKLVVVDDDYDNDEDDDEVGLDGRRLNASTQIGATTTATNAYPAASHQAKTKNLDNQQQSQQSKHQQRLKKRQSDQPTGNEAAGAGGGQQHRGYLTSDNERNKRKLAKARERRATLILGLIMAAFICSWLPFFTFYVTRALCAPCRDHIPARLEAFIFWMGYCNSAINPIIYTIFNRDFRKAFRKILFKCL